MRYLLELVGRNRLLNEKIKELRDILAHEQTDDLAKKLLDLIEEKQSVLLSIQAANNMSTIDVGSQEISIATAVLVRNTIKEKMDILTELIKNNKCSLDKIELQAQRDKFHEDYILLDMGIKKNDLQVKIN